MGTGVAEEDTAVESGAEPGAVAAAAGAADFLPPLGFILDRSAGGFCPWVGATSAVVVVGAGDAAAEAGSVPVEVAVLLFVWSFGPTSFFG